MIDEEIKKYLSERQSDLNFKELLAFMESTGIRYRDHKMTSPLGLATLYGVILDIDALKQYNDKLTFFIILHETAHFKRITKIGKEGILNLLSTDNFEDLCQHVFTEEIIADRYACLVYQHLNKCVFPRSSTQQLHLVCRQELYKQTVRELFGYVQHSEEKYMKLLESFLV